MRRFSFIERLIAVCCILAIMLSFPWTPVSAEAETGIRVTASTNASVKQGNSANAYVYIDSMESLSTLEVTVHFDPAVVQVTGSYNKVEALIYDSATTDGTLQYTYIFDGNGPNAKTQLFYFQYVVKQDAPVGDSYFDIVVGDAYDASFNTLPVSGSRCSFRVAETVTNLTCSLRGTSSVETAINQEFTLTYSFNTTSIASGSVAIRYDPELFAVSEVVQGSFLTDKMTDINTTLSGAVYLSFLGAQYGSGTQLLTLRMKTLQNVSQLSPVTVTVTDLYDLQLNPITCSGYTTPVRVTYDPAVDESAPYVFLEQDYDGDAQTVTVRVCLEENAHLGAGDFVLQFDTERLAYKSAAKGYSPTFFNINDKNTDEGLLKFSIISLKDMTEAVTMLTATFQVLTPCEDTATQLQISGSGLANHLTDPIVLNFTGCTVETAGHTVVVDQAVAPDCLNTGLTEGSHCAVCEKILVAQNVVDALGHDEIPHEALAPTCTEIGWEAYNTCSRCDYTTYVEIPANGHTFQKGVCTVCGADQDPGNTWDISEAADGSLMAKLYLNADGTYDLQLTGSGPMASWTDVFYVPWYSYRQKITGLQLPEGLQSIGSYAFYYCAALTEFTLPAGIQTIGSYAFAGCSGVTELTIPESLQALGNYAFYNCRNLTQINLNAANLVDLSSDNNVFSYAGQSGDGITVSVGNNVTKIPAYLFYPYGSSDYTPKITAVEFAEGSVCQTIGSYAFRGCTGIRSLTLPEGLQTVGSYAFIGCSGVTELTIPESLQALGNYAFYNCRNLTQINFNAANLADLSSNNRAFSYAGQSGDGITVSVGNNVTKIPAYLFYPYGSSDYTPKITAVEFAEGSVCQTIGSYAFCGCTGIRSLTLPEGLQTIDSRAFYGCTGLTELILPEGLQTIESYAFYNSTGLTELTLPEGLQSIGSYAFYDCTGIRSLALPEGLQAISSYAFYGCTDLTELTLPEGLQSIGDHAFYGCTGLIEITLPESLQTVGGYAFHSCRSLEKINFNAISLPDLSSNNHVFSYAGQDGNGVTVSVGSSVARIPAYLFYPYGNSNYTPKITVVEFAEGSCCQSIGEWAFYDCTSLTELTLPESLQTIGNYAFYNSTSLNRINFNAVSLADLSDYNYVFSYAGQGGDGITVSVGSSVTKIPAYLFCPYIYGSYMPKITIVEFAEGSVCQTIGNYAFYNCGSLTGLELPEGLRTIGSSAFCNCAALTGITLPESLETIGSYAFYNCESLIWVNFNAANLADLGYRNYVFSYAGQNGSGINVRIGSHVTKIPAYLFYPESSSGCSPKIISVVFEEGSVCQQIGASAFYQNEQLIQFCIPESVTEIGSNAFSYCSKLVITLEADALPASLGSSWNGSSTYILGVDRVVWRGRACFVVLKNGSAVLARYYGEEAEYAIADTIGNAPVVSIHDKAFYGNTSLQAIQWPESLESIGNFAFYGCTSLKEVALAEGVTTIGRTAFCGCTAVETLVLPGTLQTIGSSAFYGCTALTEIRFNALQMTDLVYDNGVFTNAGKAGDGITLTVGCLVTRIPAYLCYPGTGSDSTPKLTKIVFEDGSICESIGDTAFAHNLSLLETKLPATVKQIGSTAFGYCENLILIFEANTLPETLGSGWATDVTYYLGAPRIVTVGDGRYTIVGEAYTILSQYDGDGDTFQVEAQVEGIPVTKIDSRVFENRTKLTSVTLPESLQTIGDYAFYGCTGLAKLNIPDSLQTIGQYAFYDNDGLTKLTLPEGLREIGQYAFYGCSGLTEITLPEGLETIGNYAFFNCRDLTRINYNAASLTDLSDYNYVFSYAGQNGDGITVLVGASVTKIPARLFYPYNGTSYIPKITAVEFAEGSALQSIGNYAFYNCTGIGSLTLPEGLQSIGSYAFYNCTSLTELTLPESLQTIGNYAFYNGKSLTRISFNAASLTNLISDNHAFSYAGQNGGGITVSVGASVTKIPAYLFYPYGDSSYAPKITAVEFAQSGALQTIGARAFSGCTGISALALPEGLQRISSYAFYGCTGLTELTLPEGLQSVEDGAFSGCTVLTELTLPESLQTIGNYAFYNCKSLTKINLNAASMTDLSSDNHVFSYAGQNGNGITVSVGASVTKIPAYLFYPYGDSSYAPKLTAVKFAQNGVLQSIGNRAFSGCAGISALTLPDGLQSIGRYAFYGCSVLTELTLPESLQTIGNYAFYNCTGLTKINFNAASMTDLSSSNYVFSYAGQNGNGITVSVGASVTKIPAYLFYPYSNTDYLPKLTAVEFAEGSALQSIGYCSFYNCTGIASLTLPESLQIIDTSAFRGCTGIVSLTLPEGLQTIGDSAFYNCKSLTRITIPESLETLGGSAFQNCTAVTQLDFRAVSMNDFSGSHSTFYQFGTATDGVTVTVGSKVEQLPEFLFYGSNAPITAVVFEDGSTCQTVGRYAFYRLASLQSIELPATVQTIGEAAFMQCTGLEAFAMPADLTTIGGSAFSGCTGLRRLHLPEKLTTIGEHAFDSCTGLTEMTLPESLEAIGYSAFYNCKSLTRISFNAASMTDLSSGNYVFYRAGQDGNGITVSVGSSVTRIPAYLFYPYGNSDYTPKITAVEFAEGSVCESIGEQAFYGCAGLTELILPEGLQTIGSYAFYNSTGLTELTLPESLETIGSRAFYNCTSLTRIHFNPANLSDLSSDNDVFRYAGQSGDGITVSVGAGVTRIPAYLFYPLYGNFGYMPKITAVEFAEGSICQSIGACAFYYSASITELALPASVQTIGSNAFNGCSSLRKVTVLSAALAETLTSNNAAGCLIGQAQTVLLPGQVQLSSYLQNKYPNREQIARDGDIYWLLDQNTHSWQETQTLIQRVPCQVDGLVRYTCDHCNTYKDVTVERHTIVTHEAKEPDCETVGWYAYESCAQCAYTTYVEIPALGHWAWQKDTSGAILYTGENDGTYPFTSDGDVFASTNKLDSSTSTYVITAQEACILTVFGKISSETNYDKLFIYHNNAKIAELSGEWDWQSYTLELKVGDKVQITYQKDGSASKGQDTAWFRIGAEKKTLAPAEEVAPTCLDAVVCAVCKKEIKAALGHDEIPHAAQAVTCLEIGWDAYETCSRCDYTTYKEIPPLGHGIIKHDAVAPTCLEIGWDAYETCSRCDYTTYAELPALGHDEIAHDAKAPDCVNVGWEAYETCSRCDYTTYAEIAALGHDPVYSHTQQPTCLEVGYDIHQCTRCDYIEKHEIAALGHDPVAHEGREVTCLEIGWDAYETCSRCDYTTYKEIPALGHGIIKHDAVAPTCLEIGWDAYETCSRCDYTTYSEKPATGHWVIDVAAKNDPVYPFSFDGEVYASSNHLDNTTSVYTITAIRDCTLEFYGKVSSEGNYDKLILRHNNTVITELSGQWDWQQYTLTLIAGDTVTVSYRKDGSASSYQDTAWFRYELAEDDKIPAEDAQPTCLNAVVCSLCGEVQKEALGHDPVYSHTQQPTCLEVGYHVYACTRCDYIEKQEIAALGHVLVSHEAKAPTCTEIGWDAYEICGRCSYTTYKEIPANGHSYVETFCTVCGTKQTPDQSWDVSAAGDGSLMAHLYKNFVDGGYELEFVGSGAMADYGYSGGPWDYCRLVINRVSLPEGLTYIGAHAFQHFDSLRQIRIPVSVERIDNNAFNYAKNLVVIFEGDNAALAPSYGWYGCGYYFDPQKVILDADATYVIDKDGNAVLAKYIGAGSEFVAREEIDGIPVTQIGRYAFYQKKNLKTYWIPTGIQHISENAFSDCGGLALLLENTELPASLGYGWHDYCNYYLGAKLFAEEDFLFVKDMEGRVDIISYLGDREEAIVPARIDGCLLTRIRDYAFYGSNVKRVILPEGIVSIGAHAFENSTLEEIQLPQSIVEIKTEAFRYATKLQTIRLPEGLQRIENGVFWGCNGLKEVRIPDSITSLSSTTFTDCSNLEKVTLPKNLTSMGFMQFYGCRNLKEVELPEGVHTIESNSFYNCRSLKVVYVRSARLAAQLTGSGNAHEMIQNAVVVVVPAGSGTDYLKATYPYCETRMRQGMAVDVYSSCAHEWQTEKVSEYAQCVSDGYEIHTCSLCGVWTDDFTPMHAMEETVIEPTCTEDGYTLHTCADCGATERTDPVNKLGHTRNYGGVLCNRCGEVACLLALKNGDSLFGCGSWQEAMNEAWRGNTLVLYGDITGDVRLYQTMRLDLNGHSIHGTLTVSEGATLYGVDSATDDFTGSYGSVAAITGKFLTDSTSVDGKRYIALTGEDGISFHRLQLQLHTVSLRTTNAGIYYKASLECDEALRSAITRHGVALSLKDMPGTDFESQDLYTWMNGAPTGDFTSGSVVNIFRSGLSAQENAARGEMKIYANAYLQLADGTVLMADTTTGDTAGSYGFDGIAWSLRDVLEVLNRDIDDPAYAEHRQQILSFCETWKDALSGWQLENLK